MSVLITPSGPSLAELRAEIRTLQHEVAAQSMERSGGGGRAAQRPSAAPNVDPNAADDLLAAVRTHTEQVIDELRRLLLMRRRAMSELQRAGIIVESDVEAVLNPPPPPSGVAAIDVLSVPGQLQEAHPILCTSREAQRRFAADFVESIAMHIVTPLRQLAGMMSGGVAMDVRFDALGLSSSRSARAPLIDAWSAYADLWKDPAMVTTVANLAAVPHFFASSHLPTDELFAAAWAAIAMNIAAFGTLLDGSCPKLIRTECCEAATAMVRGTTSAVWQYLLPRADPTTCLPGRRVASQTSKDTRSTLPMDVVHPAALIAVGALRDGVLVLAHADLASLGDDEESAVSLTGTRGSVSTAAEMAKVLATMSMGLASTVQRCAVEAVERQFTHVIGVDFMSQKWHTHNPFYKGQQASHAVRFCFMQLHSQWLHPLVRCAHGACSYQGSEVHFTTPSALYGPLLTAVLRAVAHQWSILFAMTKATPVRAEQLGIDAVYVVRGVRSLRAVLPCDDACRDIDLALLRILAIAALRTTAAPTLARYLASGLEQPVPDALRTKSTGNSDPDNDEQSRGQRASSQCCSHVWFPPELKLDGGHADVVSSRRDDDGHSNDASSDASRALGDPLRWYNFGSHAAPHLRVSHADVVAGLPTADAPVSALTDGEWDGELIDYLDEDEADGTIGGGGGGGDDGPFSLQYQVSLRPELLPDALPPTEDDEETVAAVAMLRLIAASQS